MRKSQEVDGLFHREESKVKIDEKIEAWMRKTFPILMLASFIVVLSSAIVGQTPAPTVSKVEPPSWWAGHTINPVRLLVRGTNFAGAQVHSGSNAVKVSRVSINKTATYLLLDVSIDSTSPRVVIH